MHIDIEAQGKGERIAGSLEGVDSEGDLREAGEHPAQKHQCLAGVTGEEAGRRAAEERLRPHDLQ